MGWPVVTVASGGLAVVDVTATTKIGMPVTEAANGFGVAVTKVVGKPGLAVVYVTAPLLEREDARLHANQPDDVGVRHGNRTAKVR